MNEDKKKKWKKPIILLSAAAVLLVAGASVYAVSSGGTITREEAQNIAVDYVEGSTAADITKCRKDFDDGRKEYDIEIIHGGYEYDFEISAANGRILDISKEKADIPVTDANAAETTPAPTASADVATPTTEAAAAPPEVVIAPETAPSSADIGLEEAKSIALSQVSGASADSIVRAHSDYDDGRLEYDVKIQYDGYEYDFEIDGATGNIISRDTDRLEYDDLYDDDYYEDDYHDDGYYGHSHYGNSRYYD